MSQNRQGGVLAQNWIDLSSGWGIAQESDCREEKLMPTTYIDNFDSVRLIKQAKAKIESEATE
jgi:hypothetical protein